MEEVSDLGDKTAAAAGQRAADPPSYGQYPQPQNTHQTPNTRPQTQITCKTPDY